MIKLKEFFVSFFVHLFCFLFLIFVFRSGKETSAKYIEIDLSLSNISSDFSQLKELGFKAETKQSFIKKGIENLEFKEKKIVIEEKKKFVDNELNEDSDNLNNKFYNKDLGKELAKNEGTIGEEKGTYIRNEESKGGENKGFVMVKGNKGIDVKEGFSEKIEEKFLVEKLSIISQIVQKNINYPYIARKMGWEGKVIISFILTKEGKINDLWIEKSSGYEILDKNALETIQKVSKYFPIPPLNVRVKLPILYILE